MNTSKTPQTRETTKSFFGGKLFVSQRVTKWDSESSYETWVRASQAPCSAPPLNSLIFPNFLNFLRLLRPSLAFPW